VLGVLRNRTYRHLFSAQVVALVGTGLATVALGLLAYELAGANAGAVLGTALAIKMIAYVGVAPPRTLPRRRPAAKVASLGISMASPPFQTPLVSKRCPNSGLPAGR
jgi:hypothetical protein